MNLDQEAMASLSHAELLVENNRLQREIEHRVRNTLQVVSSLIDVTSRSVGVRSALTVLEVLRVRVTAMIMVYQTLDDAPHRATVNMDDTLKSLILHVAESRVFGAPLQIVDVHAKDVSLPLDDAIPLALLVVEVLLATVADIEATAASPAVSIGLTRDGGDVTLRIEIVGGREGSGDKVWNESIRVMIEALARQLGGPLDIHSEKNAITAVGIRFPFRNIHAKRAQFLPN